MAAGLAERPLSLTEMVNTLDDFGAAPVVKKAS
jgi:hypothetical protein